MRGTGHWHHERYGPLSSSGPRVVKNSVLYVMFAQAGRLSGIQVMTSTRNPTPSPNVQTNSHELFKTDACLLGTLSHALEVVGVLWVRDLF